ncbi:hypothetical protein EBU24_03885 [bacterium]|nr:hypothetical protein [bacterium]
MKKFGLCVLSMSLISLSVQATPETAQPVVSAFSAFVGSVKNAVQAQGQVLKFQVQKQQQVVTDLIKKYSNESIAQAQNNLENAKVAAKTAVKYACSNPQETLVLAKDFMLNNSKALAGTALTAYITYKVLRAFTDLKSTVCFVPTKKVCDAVMCVNWRDHYDSVDVNAKKCNNIDCRQKMHFHSAHFIRKEDGYIKSAAKRATASLLSAAAAVIAWNKLTV